MMGFIGILAFIVALLFSVMVHEAGHFLTAKGYGMKVTEFFLGFGKRLWSFRRGETEFGIKAIPAGGYCRIVGMSIHEELTPDEQPRAFFTASAPKRLVVLGAGSFLHFVLGYLFLFILLAGVGVSTLTSTIDTVEPCLTSSPCATADAPSPAKAAGLLAGDTVKSINGVAVTDWMKAVTTIRASANKELTLVVNRAGSDLTVNVTPAPHQVNGKTQGLIGVINKVGLKRQSFITSVKGSGTLTKQLFTSSISSLISLPTKIVPLFKQTFLHQKRDPQGLVGVVGVARVSAQTASAKNVGAGEKVGNFLLIIASLNIFVGIFNLLPLLPLDGGHMAIAIVDGIRRTWARQRKKPVPAPFDVERLTPITIAVFAFLAALSLLLLAADIFNPVQLNM